MIYFVRHGQTDYNLNKIFAGQQDVPLNGNGLEQARQTALELADVAFEVCFCSPLKRSAETCAEILKFHKGLNPVFDDRLKERCFGKLENKPISAAAFNRWKVGDGDSQIEAFGIEPIPDFYARVANFFEEISAQHSGKNVLVVAHSGVGRMATAYFCGIPQDNDFSEIKIPNAGVMTFNERFLPNEKSSPKRLFLSDTEN